MEVAVILDGRFITAAGVLVFFLLIILGAMGFSTSARAAPLMTGTIGAICALLELIDLSRRTPANQELQTTDKSDAKREIHIFFWVLLLIMLILLGGLIAGSVLWIAGFLRFFIHRNTIFVLVVSGSAGIFLYLLFERLLGLSLYTGLPGFLI